MTETPDQAEPRVAAMGADPKRRLSDDVDLLMGAALARYNTEPEFHARVLMAAKVTEACGRKHGDFTIGCWTAAIQAAAIALDLAQVPLGSGQAPVTVSSSESHRSPASKADGQDENAKAAAAWEIWGEVRAERVRAHQKHQATSMEAMSSTDPARYFILMEEGAGEVAKEFNDARHEGRAVDKRKLCTELIQTSAMAGAWADKLLRETEAIRLAIEILDRSADDVGW